VPGPVGRSARRPRYRPGLRAGRRGLRPGAKALLNRVNIRTP
jgi:hypothetical protein